MLPGLSVGSWNKALAGSHRVYEVRRKTLGTYGFALQKRSRFFASSILLGSLMAKRRTLAMIPSLPANPLSKKVSKPVNGCTLVVSTLPRGTIQKSGVKYQPFMKLAGLSFLTLCLISSLTLRTSAGGGWSLIGVAGAPQFLHTPPFTWRGA